MHEALFILGLSAFASLPNSGKAAFLLSAAVSLTMIYLLSGVLT